MDELTLVKHLRELVDANLVNAVSAEAFAFRHALTREAVYATLLKRQRLTYHALVAEALESEYGAEAVPAARAADLAYHYRKAANWPKALDYAQRAGEQAQQQYAPREAAQLFSQAIEAARQLGQPPQARLLRERGQAYEIIGEFEPARADYELSLGLARAAGAAADEWQALLDLGFLWAGRDYARTGAYFQQALELAQASGDPLMVAQSLNRVGNWLVNTGQLTQGLQRHYAALEIFRAQGSASGMAATHDLLGLAYGLSGDVHASAEQAEQAAVLFRQVGDQRGLISSLGVLDSLVHISDTVPWAAQPLPVCRQNADEVAGLARHIGWLAGLAEARWRFGLTLATFGMMGEARIWANEGLEIAREIDHRQWIIAGHFVVGHIDLQLLEPERAVRDLEMARALADDLGSAWWIGYAGAFLAFAHLQRGQPSAAQRELQSAASAIGLASDWPTQTPRTLIDRYLCWAWGEAALAEGRPAEALAAAGRLIASANNPGGEPLPNMLKLKADALAALGQTAEAEAALSLALAAAREHETLPLQWQILHSRARLAQQLGQGAEAARERQAADAILDQMASTLPEPERTAFRDRGRA